jgi:SAM-dependent methyltransferase
MRMGTYYRAELLRALDMASADGRVLDVGGYDGFLLSRITAHRRVSVDIDTPARFGGVDYVRGDGLSLPFAADSFDAVYALDVLEHVDNEERFTAELIRVLKPGGRLILSTPQRDIRIFPGVLTPWANRRWQHYRTPGYTVERVEALFARTNPRQCRVRRLSATWFLTCFLPLSATWRYAPRLGRVLVRAFAALEGKKEGPHGYLLVEVLK